MVTQKLPATTEFDFFVIQAPDAPSAWPGIRATSRPTRTVSGSAMFIGRFSIETFIVAPGTAGAPVVHDQGPFPDADSNPATDPVHTFQVGLWFNSPEDAAKAGCPNTVSYAIQWRSHGRDPGLEGPPRVAPDKGPLVVCRGRTVHGPRIWVPEPARPSVGASPAPTLRPLSKVPQPR